MSIKYQNKKASPNEIAKIIVDDYLDQALDFWFENWVMQDMIITETEGRAISKQLSKKVESIRKSMGMYKLYSKIENR
tara:strand:+ start:279 stop:512 length:234 start_codon:yes stop_codon:yes gene_type:complete